MNPIRRGYAGVLSDVAGAAGGRWELDVWSKWRAKLEGKYPFADSPEDVAMADYTAFFKPNTGLLWAFYHKYLHPSLEQDGDSFTPVTRFQHSINYTNEFLKCYERGAEITGDTFPATAPVPEAAEGAEEGAEAAAPAAGGSDKPLVEFDVNLHSVSESVSEVTSTSTARRR